MTVNGRTVTAYAGETIATVLFAEGMTAFYKTAKHQLRGPFCNMGTCFECQVKLLDANGSSSGWVRACMVPVEDDMVVTTADAQ